MEGVHLPMDMELHYLCMGAVLIVFLQLFLLWKTAGQRKSSEMQIKQLQQQVEKLTEQQSELGKRICREQEFFQTSYEEYRSAENGRPEDLIEEVLTEVFS